MKKRIINCENGEETIVDFTAEEITEAETFANTLASEKAQRQTDKEANDALKASAKAKLIAGEALTEDEANTIVL